MTKPAWFWVNTGNTELNGVIWYLKSRTVLLGIDYSEYFSDSRRSIGRCSDWASSIIMIMEWSGRVQGDLECTEICKRILTLRQAQVEFTETCGVRLWYIKWLMPAELRLRSVASVQVVRDTTGNFEFFHHTLLQPQHNSPNFRSASSFYHQTKLSIQRTLSVIISRLASRQCSDYKQYNQSLI